MGWLISIISLPFFKALFNYLDKYVTLILQSINQHLEEAEMKKKTAEKIKEIMATEDPIARAQRMKDWLGG
jgi:hypothetical protein